MGLEGRKWETRKWETTPLVVDGVIYFTLPQGADGVVAVDPVTGKQIWKYEAKGSPRCSNRAVSYWPGFSVNLQIWRDLSVNFQLQQDTISVDGKGVSAVPLHLRKRRAPVTFQSIFSSPARRVPGEFLNWAKIKALPGLGSIAGMRDFLFLLLHLIVMVVRLAKPGGLRSVVAETVLIRHQLLVLNRGRRRAPNLRATDRIIVGLCTLFMRRARLLRSSIVLKPSTLLHLHSVLTKRKYRLLFSPKRGRRPGPRGPTKALISAVVEMKRRNPIWGCPRIAQQIALAFGIEIDKDIVRRILSVHYRPESNSDGPSWLTFLGHRKDSLWSCDLFRCESATLRTHWVLVVMDQFTRRIIGFGVHNGIVDGAKLCRMFQRAIRGHGLPKYLSSDHDPLYRFHPWQANLRVLEVTEIKTIPYVPLSHPFVERLIGTIRREFLDRTLFWTTAELERKLIEFQHYYNAHRTHAGLEGRLPEPGVTASAPIDFDSYRWQRHCGGLYQTPIAA